MKFRGSKTLQNSQNISGLWEFMGIYGGLMGIYGGLMGSNGNLWWFNGNFMGIYGG